MSDNPNKTKNDPRMTQIPLPPGLGKHACEEYLALDSLLRQANDASERQKIITEHAGSEEAKIRFETAKKLPAGTVDYLELINDPVFLTQVRDAENEFRGSDRGQENVSRYMDRMRKATEYYLDRYPRVPLFIRRVSSIYEKAQVSPSPIMRKAAGEYAILGLNLILALNIVVIVNLGVATNIDLAVKLNQTIAITTSVAIAGDDGNAH